MESTPLMSIGALSKATGVPAETLRTWERRYGFPAPERTDTGHRRYSLRTLDRLRLVKRALDQGHRPSTVLGADEHTLRTWLAASEELAPSGSQPSSATAEASESADARTIARWLGHVERFEGRALEREFRVAAAEHAGLLWLERLVGPFLRELGARWAAGRLGVRHEHFASERLSEFVSQQWRPLSDASSGALLVLATPPGERHVLGLHMAAHVLALHGARLVFLGADAPVDELARAVAQHQAEAVVLSAAEGLDYGRLQAQMAQLRGLLLGSVEIVAGGDGFQPPIAGIRTVHNLFELAQWFEGRTQPLTGP